MCIRDRCMIRQFKIHLHFFQKKICAHSRPLARSAAHPQLRVLRGLKHGTANYSGKLRKNVVYIQFCWSIRRPITVLSPDFYIVLPYRAELCRNTCILAYLPLQYTKCQYAGTISKRWTNHYHVIVHFSTSNPSMLILSFQGSYSSIHFTHVSFEVRERSRRCSLL